jgi:UDPglucose 6-dehydrogenase
VVSNPEFLKEGAAVEDFLKPDRVVLGVESEFATTVMGELYAPFVRTGRPVIYMDIASAEMTKYAANGMLATRISFMNEIAALCEATGADVDDVRRGLGSDTRIGPSFLCPGPGSGGSCFPKDVKALVRTGAAAGVPLEILGSVDSSNDRQKHRLGEKVRQVLTSHVIHDVYHGKTLEDVDLQRDIENMLDGCRVAVWGLSFKPGTDDMREAPALVLIHQLLDWGATVSVHDPAAMDEARRRLGDAGGKICYAETGYEALAGADALVIVTDWNEYRHPDFNRLKATLKRPIIVDGRNLYDPRKMFSLGLSYYSIGRRSTDARETTA